MPSPSPPSACWCPLHPCCAHSPPVAGEHRPTGTLRLLPHLFLGEIHECVVKVIPICPEMNSVMPQLTLLYL